MDFLAIDVETANPDYSSLCQIGIARFKNGRPSGTWKTLVNPEQEFNEFNSRIHGIRKEDVINAPTFKEIYPDLYKKLYRNIVIHYSHFDRVAISRACKKYNLPNIKTDWLDSCKIARRTWEQFAYSGYGLSNIARHLNIEFDHHDALEDAITAGKITCEACKKKGISIEMWTLQVERPIRSNVIKAKPSKTNPNGHLFGETVVFTGTLKSYSRKTAKQIAKEAGCVIKNNVSKKVSILVLGIQDPNQLAGHKKSSKHRKVEKLIEKGHDIRIMSEHDFLEICKND